MKRRGVLGLLGGAAVSAPSMVKAAAAQMADLSLPNLLPLGMTGASIGADASSQTVMSIGGSGPDYAMRLARFISLSDERRMSIARSRTYIDRLDPDLASYRSFSLSAKIAMQRDRNARKWIEQEEDWLSRAVDGIFDSPHVDY